jgi:hypothetical protein
MEKEQWDWDTGDKLIADINEWKKRFPQVRELIVSPDGEKIATVVQAEDGAFTTCVNGDAWEETFERVWSLKFNSINQLASLVYKNYEAAVAIDKELWEDRFDFVWNLETTPDEKGFIVNVKKEETNGICLNGKTWENRFEQVRNVYISPDGAKTATTVQTKRLKEGDIFGFQEGVWTVAVDGVPWDKNFVNVWGLAFSPDGNHLAAEVRLNLYEYTIAIDGEPWPVVFGCVWEPVYKPGSNDVLAPVKISQGWTLALNGKSIWDNFVQVYRQKYSPDGKRLAAVVATGFGKWTIAVDGKPWERTFSDTVLEPHFSPDSKRVAALVKESVDPFDMESALHNIPGNDRWSMCVDGNRWAEDFDMIWDPVFSPDSQTIVTKAERDGKYFIAVDGKVGRQSFDALWQPAFSPDGKKLLVRYINDGKYHRSVTSLDKI